MTGPSYFDHGRERVYSAFRAELDAGRVSVQQCPGCATRHHPPVLRCGACGSAPLGWAEVGSGTVLATSAQRGTTAVLVDVGGVRLLTTAADEEAPPPGARVRLEPAVGTDGNATGGIHAWRDDEGSTVGQDEQGYV